MAKRSFFTIFAAEISFYAGKPMTFVMALLTIVAWAFLGPLFNFSDTWQLVINTGTTIVTFLMVFLIQNTQNRDSRAVQLKLDELIRATRGAHVSLLDLEEFDECELRVIQKRYENLAKEAHELLRQGKSDTRNPKVQLD